MSRTKLSIVAAFALAASSAHAVILISGSSLVNATGLADGDIGIYIISDGGAAFNTMTISSGGDLLDSATYGPGFTVLGAFGNITTSGIGTVIASGQETDEGLYGGDNFALITFGAATSTAGSVTPGAGSTFTGGTAFAGEAYSVWFQDTGGTGDWDLPSGSGTFNFQSSPTGDNFQQLVGAANFTANVIPEPSAALLGALGGLMLLRRRRND